MTFKLGNVHIQVLNMDFLQFGLSTLCSFGVIAVDPCQLGCFQKIDGDISKTNNGMTSKLGSLHIQIGNMDFLKFRPCTLCSFFVRAVDL